VIRFPESIDSKYRFVIVSALRARQIQNGSPPLIEAASGKPATIAQKEVLSELVPFTIPDPESEE
jgi:DNA-directed RNA polymerase omega subunit